MLFLGIHATARTKEAEGRVWKAAENLAADSIMRCSEEILASFQMIVTICSSEVHYAVAQWVRKFEQLRAAVRDTGRDIILKNHHPLVERYTMATRDKGTWVIMFTNGILIKLIEFLQGHQLNQQSKRNQMWRLHIFTLLFLLQSCLISSMCRIHPGSLLLWHSIIPNIAQRKFFLMLLLRNRFPSNQLMIGFSKKKEEYGF